MAHILCNNYIERFLMNDLVIRNASLPDGRKGIDIAIQDGRIVAEQIIPTIQQALLRSRINWLPV